MLSSLTFFIVEHIPASGAYLIGFVSLRMFKWDTITPHKSLSFKQAVFAGTAKQLIVDLDQKRTKISCYVWRRKVVTPKAKEKTALEKRASRKVFKR